VRLEPDLLRRVPAFASLPDEAVQALALCFTGRRYAAGEIVFREGDPASSVLFIAEGDLAVSARTVPARQIRVGRGQILGEAAIIDHTPRTATAAAAGPATVYELGEDALVILRAQAPAAVRALTGAAIGAVARRLRQLEQRVQHELERGVPLP
jgi:CRP-like cAMP-binding protein